jgi:hypothetical protein
MDLHNRGEVSECAGDIAAAAAFFRFVPVGFPQAHISVAPDTVESSYQFFVTRKIADTPTFDVTVFRADPKKLSYRASCPFVVARHRNRRATDSRCASHRAHSRLALPRVATAHREPRSRTKKDGPISARPSMQVASMQPIN